MITANISKIVPNSFVDGPGKRTVVFFQGCTLACKGCQSKHLWPHTPAYVVNVPDLVDTIVNISRGKQVAVSGGECMQQPAALEALVVGLKKEGMHVVVYTGYSWEELHANSAGTPWAATLANILSNIDVLVDGRFQLESDDDFVTWRGSRNQRPIDVQETLRTGVLTVLDWDNEIVLTEDGSIVAPSGFARMLEAVGEVENNRRCGQSK